VLKNSSRFADDAFSEKFPILQKFKKEIYPGVTVFVEMEILLLSTKAVPTPR
jgi:hypothetical protein